MSIRDRLKVQEAAMGVFGVVGGLRLDGKSSLAGTLKGSTLMLQAAELETGSSSAKQLAELNGNKIQILTFTGYADLMTILADPDLIDFNNIYIDGVSAITEMRTECDDFKRMAKKNIWDAYRLLGDDLRAFLRSAKRFTSTGQNVFVTMAYKPKFDTNGNIVSLDPDVKGNITISEIQRLCPTVLAVTKTFDEDGNLHRKIITKSNEVYPARIDSLLDGNNPGVVEANLTKVIDLIKGA